MVYAILVMLFPPTGWACFRCLARLGPPRECVCRCYNRFSHILEKMRWLTWMPLPSSLPFLSPFDCRCGEPAGEGERRRPFSSPYCDLTNAVSPLGVLFGIVFAHSCRFPFAQGSYCRSVLVSTSRCEMRILDFMLEKSLGH